jgi:cation:H+ antiporter
VLLPLLQFGVCAVVIIVAGTFLSKYADVIAELTGLGRLLIGCVLCSPIPLDMNIAAHMRPVERKAPG